MAIPRSVEDSNKQMRNAAIDRLRSQYGVKITKHSSCATRIAEEIHKVDPSLPAGEAMTVIRAWVALRPSEVVPARLAFGSGQPYTLDTQMRLAKARLQDMRMPSPVNMTSKVLYSPEYA
jgi:predicted oxidoreductase